MAPRKILAVSDTHVDDRMTLAGLTPTDSETGEPLVLAQARRMLAWVAQVARREGVDLIVHCGDAYERPRPSPASEAVFAQALDAWCEIAPVVLLLGNHDRPHGTEAHALEPLRHRRPGRLYVADRPEALGVYALRGAPSAAHFDLEGQRIVGFQVAPLDPQRGRPEMAVFPVPYPSRSYVAERVDGTEEQTAQALSQALDRVILAHAVQAERLNVPTVLIGHGTLSGAEYREYQTVPLSDLQIRTEHFDRFTVSAWGHLHKRQDAPGHAGRVHGYVGSPDRHDFGEEHEAKGVTVFELDDAYPGKPATGWHFEEYPGARCFETWTADDFERAEFSRADARVPAGIQHQIFRVVGEVDDARFEAIAARVRSLKGKGVTIRNDCAVVREDRARVQNVQAELGMRGALIAACESRPDLTPNTQTILENVAQLRGGAL